MSARPTRQGDTGNAALTPPDRCLLDAAVLLGAEVNLAEMLRTIGEAMSRLPGLRFVGLGQYDARRKVLVLSAATEGSADQGVRSSPTPPQDEEFTLSDTEATSLLTEPVAYASPTLTSSSSLPIERRLYDTGARRYAAIPLLAQKQLFGVLYAGFGESRPIPDDTLVYLQRLARLVTPAFVNYRTRIRLAKGDRRRATLVELSHAINTSLRLETVLDSAREAIGRIEGHRASIIGLFDEDQNLVRAYWQPRTKQVDRGAAEEPEILPIKATALSWVQEHHEAYESGDLERKVTFDLDTRLRTKGVRRYAVAPMFVRGRVIGGFLFGTTDPYPALTTDVWLYENIALQLALAIDNAVQFEELERLSDRIAQQNIYLREEIATEHNVEGMIGRSPAIRRVFDEIARVAQTDATVLIMGETGVGKELVARAIHTKSHHADQPLVKVNCAAIPENLVESELFGHERGAFTSATSRRIGRFELARDGSLFLDEVGELSLAVQAKLLRVLQDGEFERVGGTQTIQTEARIIAATNRDLVDAVETGTFRSDLFYRLNAFPIVVAPLVDRRDDIPLLVETFITQINRRMGKNVRAIDTASLDYLRQRDWPGNIRELWHVIERAMILCDGPTLVIEPAEVGPTPRVSRRERQPVKEARGATQAAARHGVATMQETERSHILQTLEETRWVIEGPRGAANLLGFKPSTLRSRMKRLGIER